MTDPNLNSSAQLLSGLINEWLEFSVLAPNKIVSDEVKRTKIAIGESLPQSTRFNYIESHERRERNRITELLKLSIENNDESADSTLVAEKIEQCLFSNYFYNAEAFYYSKARTLCDNLARNGKYLLTHYDPQILCFFPTEALASGTALEEWRNHYKYMLEQKLLAQQNKHKGFFECQHCHSKNTDWSQSQTRSADEPATIFIVCFDCGAHFRR